MDENKEKTPFFIEFKNNYGAATATNPGNHNTSISGSGNLPSATSPLPFFIRSRGLAELRQHCHRQRTEGIDKKARKKLIIASTLCLVFMILEIIGGILSNSLAIATDAAHLLTDFASFMISLFALWLAARPSTQRMSFGWYRAEVIGALASVFMIWVITGVLVYLAIQRVITGDYEVDAKIMLITSAIAIAFNVFMGITLSHGGPGHSHFGHGHSHGGGAGHGHSHGCDGHEHGHTHVCGHCQITFHENADSQDTDYYENNEVTKETSLDEIQPKSSNQNIVTLAAVVEDTAFNQSYHGYNDSISIKNGSTLTDSQTNRQILNTDYIMQMAATPTPCIVTIPEKSQPPCSCGNTHLAENCVSHHSVSAVSTRGENGQIKERFYSDMTEENINVRAAFIHVVGDVLQSVGVFVAALLIFVNPSWAIADPICTFIFSVIVLFTTFAILKDTLLVLMEATPSYIEYNDIADTLKGIPCVRHVHNLRIWALSVNKVAVCAHLAVESGTDTRRVLDEAVAALHKKYNFFETTIQVEDFSPEMDTCKQCILPTY